LLDSQYTTTKMKPNELRTHRINVPQLGEDVHRIVYRGIERGGSVRWKIGVWD
jgi:hypothetical protein